MNDMGIPFDARNKFSNIWLLLYFSASTEYCCVMLMKLGFTAEQPEMMSAQKTKAIRANDLMLECIKFSKNRSLNRLG